MKKIRKKNIEKKPSLEIARVIARAALDKKAEDLLILDVREISSFTDYFVIMSGRSTRHVQGLAEVIDGELRLKKLKEGSTEGLQEGHWVLLDYGDVVVHVFYTDERQFYDLEGLWHDAAQDCR